MKENKETINNDEGQENLSRRDFLTKAGAGIAAASAATAGMTILPVHAEPITSRKKVDANSKITLGLIGCGGMGPDDMHQLMDKPDVEFAALCDVDESHIPKHAADVEKKYSKKPDTYKDYRKLLERKDIDGVVIGTPDHWHALILVHAVEAGKDAYCEKPISHDIHEAKTMAAAVAHHKKIVQVGTWQRSKGEFTSPVDYVRSGKAGKIVLCRAWSTDTRLAGKVVTGPPPASLDYDMWVGPAAMVPYAENRCHYKWRWFYNFGTGKTGDWGVHMMDIALLGMSKGTDLVMPEEVVTYGGKWGYPDDGREAPDTVQSIMRFKDPDFVLHWQTGRDYPGRPEQGVEFVGDTGKTVRAWRGGWEILDEKGELVPKERTPSPNDHWQNWVDCLKSREQPRSNLASMAQTTIVCHLANASYLAGEPVRWSKEQMDIVGRAGKDTIYYQREYRKPWKLPVYKA